MKIIDHFLSEDDFEWIFLEVNAHDRGWYFSEILSSSYIAGCLRDQGRLIIDPILNSQFCFKLKGDEEYIQPLLNKLGAKKIERIKVNMTLPTKKHVHHGFHVDFADDWMGNNPWPCKTAIFYINDNNGYTEFEETGEKVESKSNRVVIFDNGLQHAGVTTTNTINRIVMNVNYYTEEDPYNENK